MPWLSPAMAVSGAVAAAWGLSRAGTAQAWKSTAEGRGEELADLRRRVEMVEQENVTLRAEVVRLEGLPDYREVMACLREIRETLNEVSERWG